MFEKALRMKLRFPWKTGTNSLTTEQLWDLSLADLDSVYGTLESQRKEKDSASLLRKRTSGESKLQLMLDVVKYIFETLQSEQEAAQLRSLAKQKREQIDGLIALKEQQKLMDMSIEDLAKLRDEL